MANDIQQHTAPQGEIILYQPDETVRLEVRLEDETVWLSQQQMADLFGTNRQAITKHLKNIYSAHELVKDATCSILELVRQEGNRMVTRKIEFYNLDAIISVGFRVNTQRGIEFRTWVPASKTWGENGVPSSAWNILPALPSWQNSTDKKQYYHTIK